MKSIIKLFSLVLLCTLTAGTIQAQDKVKKIETCEIEVAGVCKMCKKRIENAALIKGVKMAQWDQDSQMLKVVYNPSKTTEETIHKSVSDAGHDTNKVTAPDEAYKKLPGCCLYRDGVKPH